MSPRDSPSSEVLWLWAGKNSRVSHSKVKAGLFREVHTRKTEGRPSQKVREVPSRPGIGSESESGPEVWE